MANCLDENYQQQRRDARGREITARLLGRLLRHDIPLEIAEVTWEGDVIYRIPYSELKLQQSEIMIMPFVRSPFFSNFLTELTLRRSRGQFSDLLSRVPSSIYRSTVAKTKNKTCGLWLERFALRGQFHLSLLYESINEELLELIRSTK